MGLLLRRSEDISTALHVLLEHLDASLDIADAMSGVRGTIPDLAPDADTDAVLDRLEALQRFANDMRTLEAALLTKVRQSRHWADRLVRLEPAPDVSLQLFLSGTVALTDAIERMARPQDVAFESGDQLLPYLRDRGLVPAETLSLDGAVTVPDASRVLIAGWVPLADYMALVSETLDSLAEAYGFATWEETSKQTPPPTVEVGSFITGGKDFAGDTGMAVSSEASPSAPVSAAEERSTASDQNSSPGLVNAEPSIVATPVSPVVNEALPTVDAENLDQNDRAAASDEPRPETKAPDAPAQPDRQKSLVARVMEVAE